MYRTRADFYERSTFPLQMTLKGLRKEIVEGSAREEVQKTRLRWFNHMKRIEVERIPT